MSQNGTFFILSLIIAIFILSIDCKPSALDQGNACIIRYLKSKNRLDEDFPVSDSVDTSKCNLVMPIIMKAFEAALCKKLTDEKSIEAECVMEYLKQEGAMDFMLVEEVIVMSKGLNEEKGKQIIEETKEQLRIVFEDAAKVCKSDPNYGGLFDDVLEIRNESLAVLRRDYCFKKFVIESKLIDVKDVDVNPRKISTSNIDCQTMIKNNRLEREKKLEQTLKSRKMPKDQIQCIMDKFQIERAFDSNLALEVIDQIDVTIEVRRINRQNIAKRLEKFINAIFMCVGRTNIGQSSVGDPITILNF